MIAFNTARILDAVQFAVRQHGTQLRKYTGAPYITHPIAVAKLVLPYVGDDEEAVIAALLHDVVEDTPCQPIEIYNSFGATVLRYVEGLTDVSKPADGNRAARKEIDRRHTAQQPPIVKTIKLADLIDNSRTIVQHDPNFAKVYMEEKGLLLYELSEGHPELFRQAEALLWAYYNGDHK